ncbi:MAG TPA: ABC transporter substrate-binding protein [Stellaceae bacterium]|nr:ABC transporter substrate-binding protein [Stellaceae bacterium]
MKSVAAILLVILGALAPAPASAEAITVGVTKNTVSPALLVAQEKGFFAAEGLQSELKLLVAGAEEIAVAVASGAIDFGGAGTSGGLFNLGGQVRIVAGGIHEAPGFQGLAMVASNRAWDGGLKSYRDLGAHLKTFAVTEVGGPTHYALVLAAAKYQFDLGGVRLVPLQSAPNEMAALIGGQVDATAPPTSSAAHAIQAGSVKLLGYVGDETPFQFGAVFASLKTANERRDTVERFLRAYRKAARLYHDAFTGPDGKRRDGPDAPELLALLGKDLGLGIEDVRFGISSMDSEGRLDVKDVLRQIEWFKGQGMVKPGVDAAAVIDTRYVVALPEQ